MLYLLCYLLFWTYVHVLNENKSLTTWTIPLPLRFPSYAYTSVVKPFYIAMWVITCNHTPVFLFSA